VSPWIDPDETARETWAGDAGRQTASRTVYERAHATSIPYERRENVLLSGPAVAAEFQNAQFDNAKLHYSIGVDANERVKVLSKGHLWGSEETHQRFRIQYRRPAEPTTTAPFEEYSAWVRFQMGTVSRDGDGLSFDPDPSQTEEKTLTLSWPKMYSADQLRLAEAELVRNPPLARYALSQKGLWEDIRDALRYNPDAFDRRP
jgi:hypothetical protein